jgi:hypothetical protein
MKARTSKADEIHDYYIKLESFVHEIVNEESNELRTKLLINKKENEELKNRVDELELINIKQSKKLQNFRPDDIDKKSQRIGNISDSAYILYAFEINNLRYKCGLWRYNKIGELEKQLRKEYANGIIKYSIKVSDPIIEKFMTFIMTDKLTLTGHKTFDGNFNTIKEIIDICERLEYILITNDTFNILDGLINFNTVENQK